MKSMKFIDCLFVMLYCNRSAKTCQLSRIFILEWRKQTI